MLWKQVAYLAIFAGILGNAINREIRSVPAIPEWAIYGLISAAADSVFVVGVLFFVGGRRGWLTRPTDPGLLRFLFPRQRHLRIWSRVRTVRWRRRRGRREETKP
jgi:hypothetical protein